VDAVECGQVDELRQNGHQRKEEQEGEQVSEVQATCGQSATVILEMTAE
jgi:hypothetical protein